MFAAQEMIDAGMCVASVCIIAWVMLQSRSKRSSAKSVRAPQKSLNIQRASSESTSASLPAAKTSSVTVRKAAMTGNGVDVMCRNLPNRMTEEVFTSIVEEITSNFVSVIIPFDSTTGANKGYGFVKLTDKATAVSFIEAIHGRTFVGLKIDGSAIRSTKDLRAQLA